MYTLFCFSTEKDFEKELESQVHEEKKLNDVTGNFLLPKGSIDQFVNIEFMKDTGNHERRFTRVYQSPPESPVFKRNVIAYVCSIIVQYSYLSCMFL